MRILHAMAGAEFGGAEAFFTRLVIAMHNAGMHQQIILRPHAGRMATLKEAGINPIEAPFGSVFDLKTPFIFKREIKRFKPHIVITWMNRASKFCPKGDFVHVARLGGYYNLKYYSKCDYLIGNTPDIVDYLVREGWDKEKTRYLPNFANTETMPAVPRKKLFTPQKAPLILALGRLHENKAFDTLLDALVKVPEAYLWLSGEGPLREKLEEQAMNLGVKPRIRFLGWRDDVPALLAAADILVCPSRHEPLGNVVLEGWAQKTPVVATNSAGPEMLINNEKNGLLTPIDDANAMAEAIKRLIKEPDFAEKLSTQAFKDFNKKYTKESVLSQYNKFFEDILKD